MERLSGLDASFLYLETPSLHMHVAMAMVFDPSTVPGGYSFERMKAVDRRPGSPSPRCSGGGWWRSRSGSATRCGWTTPTSTSTTTSAWPPCPRPGGLRELADLAGDITGRPLDRARPLWEMWIVEGLAEGRIGFIAKMHHSTVDGVSGAALLSVLFDLEPPSPPPRPCPPSGRSTPGCPRGSS